MSISTRKFGPFALLAHDGHCSSARVLSFGPAKSGFSATVWHSRPTSGAQTTGWAFHWGDRSLLSLSRDVDGPNGDARWHCRVLGRTIRAPLLARTLSHLQRAGSTVASMYWPPGPIFVERFSRDCDLCERTWVQEFPSRYALLRAMEHAYEWAEGPEHWSRISEAEYNEALEAHPGGTFRDRIAEMAGY